ncbi:MULTISPECIES: YidC/Oxa1 family membrane protein insertase [unclassified Streptomyces]|uniref:YidC/Oxa1 family membrane protein insertase n=1 Tax=unclassified Streptomyces TaxID=2593676 RepID=UPI0033C045E2
MSMFGMSVFDVFASLVERLADLVQPAFHGSAAAAAIVLFTLLVRLAVHPLSRQAARGQQARAKLQPRLAELRKKHGKDPERLRKAVAELHAAEKVSPFSGCLPSLLQLPAFFLLYQLFSHSGHTALLDHTLLSAPLRGHWADALGHGGPLGGQGLVYLALFVFVAGVATFTYSRTKRQLATQPLVPADQQEGLPGLGVMTKLMPLMSFGTLITVAVVPLAAALYVVTSTTWSALERAYLYRDMAQAPKALKASEAPKTTEASEAP